MILAIESSCDETAIAAVDAQGNVLFNTCLSQIAIHKKYGGVVPEIASRAHFEGLGQLSEALNTALEDKKLKVSDIECVAATMGPGLVGPLLVGSSFARGLAAAWEKPFVGVHHLRAHIASALLSDESNKDTLRERAQKIFPALVLLVSGGHCQLIRAQADLGCEILKTTSDDAAGECFDKCAKLIGLSYPGGPAIEALARECVSVSQLALAKEWTAKLPRPKSREGFSFAGLKTAFRLLVEQDVRAKENLPSLAKALETTIADTLISVLNHEYEEQLCDSGLGKLICCGGVSANLYLRKRLDTWCQKNSWSFLSVPLKYTTDNAVMVALAAAIQGEKFYEKSVFPRGHL